MCIIGSCKGKKFTPVAKNQKEGRLKGSILSNPFCGFYRCISMATLALQTSRNSEER